MAKGSIYSISISPERGQLKKEVVEAVVTQYGIENDGHAGEWGRQITCLNWGSVLKANMENNLQVGPGEFAENVLIEGLDLSHMVVGDRLKMGDDVILEVYQIGKEDHPGVVTRTLGITLLPYEGLFCKVVQGGTLKKGDPVKSFLFHN
ncbi:MOSC domain-containing protein [Desulfosporosinus fructosivorans]